VLQQEQEDGCQRVDEQLLRLEVANSVASKYEAYVCPVSFDLMQVCVCVCVKERERERWLKAVVPHI